MKVNYGSPGHRGVTQLMHVGDIPSDDSKDVAKTTLTVLEIASLGLWAYGWKTKNKTLKKIGGTASIGFLVARLAIG